MTYRMFAVSAPGLTPYTRAELLSLGLQPLGTQVDGPVSAVEETGGVEFDARPLDLCRVNLHLRTASRVIARMGEFDAVGFDELRRKAVRLSWREFIRPGQQVAIRVTCHKSRLYHSAAVGREMANAISASLKGEVIPAKTDPDAETPAQLIIVRLVNDHCTISLDTSGALLHRRGYRLQTAKAPLRETLAAGLLMAAGWDGSSPLIDPFCGSGTIPIEAALMVGHIAPGKNRRFAFMDWPNYKASVWNDLLEEAATAETQTLPPILGSDRDEGAVQISQENARRANILERIDFSHRAFSAVEPPEQSGWLVTNPPYGVRISPSTDLRNLYSRLGDLLREKFGGWHYGVLCGDPVLAGHMRLKPESELRLVNGGIAVRLYSGKIRN
jgi:putative N6-adenine-specific DNA methylase